MTRVDFINGLVNHRNLLRFFALKPYPIESMYGRRFVYLHLP